MPFFAVGRCLVLMYRKVARIKGGSKPPDTAALAGRIPTFKKNQQRRADLPSNLAAQPQAQSQKLLLARLQEFFVFLPFQPLAQIDMIQN